MKYIIILSLLILLSILGFYYKSHDEVDFIENFDSFSNYVLKEKPNEIYDKFYANIYTELFGSPTKDYFEIYNIKLYTIDDNTQFKKNDINILDLGCGCGKHLEIFNKYKYNCTGLDNSMNMLEKARKITPESKLIKGDFHNKNTFKSREFTHITCLFYSLYYSKEIKTVINNSNFWLKPGGFLCVHLVDPKNFDPVLEKASGLIPLYNPQKHSKTRVTKTKLKFNKFNYLADWTFDGNNATFEENFLFNDNSRHLQNKHSFIIKPIKHYVKNIEKLGFKLIKIIDLTPVNHDKNYIYIFKKKYGE